MRSNRSSWRELGVYSSRSSRSSRSSSSGGVPSAE